MNKGYEQLIKLFFYTNILGTLERCYDIKKGLTTKYYNHFNDINNLKKSYIRKIFILKLLFLSNLIKKNILNKLKFFILSKDSILIPINIGINTNNEQIKLYLGIAHMDIYGQINFIKFISEILGVEYTFNKIKGNKYRMIGINFGKNYKIDMKLYYNISEKLYSPYNVNLKHIMFMDSTDNRFKQYFRFNKPINILDFEKKYKMVFPGISSKLVNVYEYAHNSNDQGELYYLHII